MTTNTVRGGRLVSTLAIIVASAWVTAATALVMAIPAGINDGPSGACLDAWDDRVVFDGPIVYEAVGVRGSWQLFPFGVECEYAAPSGQVVLVEPSVLPSVIVLVAVALTVALAVIVGVRRVRAALRTSAARRSGRTHD